MRWSIRAASAMLPGWPRCRRRASASRQFRSSSRRKKVGGFAQSYREAVANAIEVMVWPWNQRAAVALPPVPLSGSTMNILDPQGPIGAAEKTILIDSLAIMLAIVLPTIIAIFAFAFWFRASNTRAFHWPDWAYSGRI